tara:strand:- start:20115 stop:22082 length:1968 start_codon:yes stop_codon:yes gene_type:complete
MPFTKFQNLDFDQIKTSIKDYLRANSNFTDFDFEGSNFSILIDTLAYNTYITAFNSNMVVNESFLDSATLRENVVSLARNIGYVPRSKTAATARVSFTVDIPTNTKTATLKPGLVCVGNTNDSSYLFSTTENISAPAVFNGADPNNPAIGEGWIAQYNNIEIKEGTFLSKQFVVDGSLDQRFILNNANIDTSTVKVYVNGPNDVNPSGSLGTEYSIVDNILNINSTSEIYLIQEIQDEQYELLFGDGFFGKKLEDSTVITVNYIITNGKDGNGIGRGNTFSYSGRITGDSTSNSTIITKQLRELPEVTTDSTSQNGSDIESVDSIKYFAPRTYSSQYRAVTPRDYEAIVKKIYPDTESVAVVGGEEMDPPQFGNVIISIKPKNGYFVSGFNKSRILSQLKQYTVSGINQKLEDLKILYVEIDSSVYYNDSRVTNANSLNSLVSNSLTSYANSLEVNKFGGRFKYSKLQSIIDNTHVAITSNITKVIIRRNLKCAINQFAQYELCYGNRFHVNFEGFNIKSTGFYVPGNSRPVYMTDTPDFNLRTGVIAFVEVLNDGSYNVVSKSAGTVDYIKGEILISTTNITSTVDGTGIVEIQAIPESNDVVGLRELYLNFSVEKSKINIVRDVISSGDEITGTTFVKDFYTSSYLNGQLIRV